MQAMLDILARIERKLDILIEAIIEETDDQDNELPSMTLDGEPCGRARDDSQPL